MLARFRRFRLLALVAFLAAPGLGATWLPLVHRCGGATGMPAIAHSEHPSDHHSSPASHICHCIGACHGATAAPSLAAPRSLVAATSDYQVPPFSTAPLVRLHFFLRHLPPATAPPLV
jgi:hypothetical protein